MVEDIIGILFLYVVFGFMLYFISYTVAYMEGYNLEKYVVAFVVLWPLLIIMIIVKQFFIFIMIIVKQFFIFIKDVLAEPFMEWMLDVMNSLFGGMEK